MATSRQHPYCYEGTETLINHFGLRDRDRLEEAERSISGDASLTMPLASPLTAAGFRAMHRHLLRDVYGWAGSYRTVDTGRGDAPFCKSDYVADQMERRFARMAGEGFLSGTTPTAFARRAAEHVDELNAIHPFLDGNGRTTRAFLKTLGRQAGHWIDLSRIEPRRWNAASREGFLSGDNASMADVLELAVAGRADEEPAIDVGGAKRPARSRSAGRDGPSRGRGL